MSTRIWAGHQSAKKYKVPYTVGGTIETDDLFKYTTNNKVLSVTAGSTNINLVASGIIAAWNANTEPEFEEATASDGMTTGSGILYLEVDTTGKEFTTVATTTESGGGAADTQTFTTGSAIQGLEGPNVVNATNFGGTLPINGDTLIFQDASTSMLYSLSALSGVTLDLLDIHSSFTGKIGLPEYNSDQTAKPYDEYRTTYLAVGATACRIGWGTGNGSGRLKLNFGSVQTAIEVYSTGSSADNQYHPLQIKGTNASNVMNIYGGKVDICPLEQDTSAFTTIRVSGTGEIRGGPGLTLNNFYINGGTAILNLKIAVITNLEILGGATVEIMGTFGITNLYVRNGTLKYNSSGNINNLNIGSNGVFDISKNSTGGFISSNQAQLDRGGKILDPFKKVTWTNGIKINGKLSEVTIDLGTPAIIEPSFAS